MRSDKKKDVPLILSAPVYRAVLEYAKAHALSKHIPQALNKLSLYAAEQRTTATTLAPYFKRGLMWEEGFIFYHGHQKTPDYKPLLGDLTMGTRVHCKFTYEEWVNVSRFEVALGCPLNHAVSLLVIMGLELYSKELKNFTA